MTYCIFNRDDILRFAFDCFDVDGSGKIDREEAESLINMLNSQVRKLPLQLASLGLPSDELFNLLCSTLRRHECATKHSCHRAPGWGGPLTATS